MYRSQKINTVKSRSKNPTGPLVITAKPIRQPEKNAEIQSMQEVLIKAEQRADATAPEQMSEDALNYLLSEDIYQGTLSWQGNKASTKFNYYKPKKNR